MAGTSQNTNVQKKNQNRLSTITTCHFGPLKKNTSTRVEADTGIKRGFHSPFFSARLQKDT